MNNLLKSLLGLSVIASFLLTTGFGCKGATTAEQQATKPITLEYWTVFDDVDVLQSLVTQFKADHPYINVNLRQLRQDEFYNRLTEALAEDKGPDIISVQNKNLLAYVSKLASMPASVKDTTVKTVKGTVGSSTQINTVTKNMVTVDRLDREYVQAVKRDVVVDGKIYGLPMSMDVLALYYNKDLVDRSGVAETPKTWDDFQKAVKKITKYDKQSGKILQAGAAFGTGNNVVGSDDLLYLLYKQSGLNFTTKTGAAAFNGMTQGNETNPITIMNFYADFANSTRDTYTWNESMGNAFDKFTAGSVAFFFGYSYHDAQIKARAPQLNYGILPMLQLNSDQPVNAANYWVQSVVGKSKYQNEAWNLVDYLTHSKATKDYLDKTGRPTALRAYVAAQNEIPELAPFASQVLVAENWYRGRNYEAAMKAVNDMIHQWLEIPTNTQDVNAMQNDILNKAAAKVNQTL